MANLPPLTPTSADLPRRPSPGLIRGFSLVETMVALAVIGLTLLGVVGGISNLRNENRATTQRMLAASLGSELLELVKSLSTANLRNSTAASPVYLKTTTAGTPNLAWRVPQVSESLALPVEDVNSGSGSDPALVANKLPQATWSAVFTPDAVNNKLIYVTINVEWRLNQTSRGRALQYSLNSAVASGFAQL